MAKETELNIIDGQFKDQAPLETIKTIQGILSKHNIETEEFWRQTGVPYCHALSVRIVGTNFCTNGKGLTPEFARASAYGELMERLQIGAIATAKMQKDGMQGNESSRMTSSVDALLENESWYNRIAQRLQRTAGIHLTPRQILTNFASPDGTLTVVPFYNLTKNKSEVFPLQIRSIVYTSNGCAAGNTPEEALVQGISEIVERHHMALINDLGCALPEIPEQVLQSYPIVSKIISHLRENGYRVTIKDCTLGQKFPVVCVCMVHQKTGRYHTHYGAYPILEIALERALTESFQGYHIHNIARYEDFLLKKPGELSISSITNEMAYGTNEKLTSYFVGKPEHDYNASMGFESTTNRGLLLECIDYFKAMNFEILARDLSCLGFCTYQIVIPGYSEVFPYRLSSQHNEYRYHAMAVRAICDPVHASLPDKLGLLMHLEELKKSAASAADTNSFLAVSRIHAELTPQRDQFLMTAALASIYFDMGKHQLVSKMVKSMLSVCADEDAEKLLCLKRSLDLKAAGYDAETIRDLLLHFHTEQTAQRVLRGENILRDFVVRCDRENCKNCPIEEQCHQAKIAELTALIQQKSNEMDTEKSQQILKDLL